MIRRPPRSTRTDTLFPYTTLFRSYDRSDVLSLRMRSGKAGSFPELLGPQEAEWVIARCNEGLSTAAWRMFMEGGGYAGGRHRPTVWTTAPAIAAVRKEYVPFPTPLSRFLSHFRITST